MKDKSKSGWEIDANTGQLVHVHRMPSVARRGGLVRFLMLFAVALGVFVLTGGHVFATDTNVQGLIDFVPTAQSTLTSVFTLKAGWVLFSVIVGIILYIRKGR